MLAEFWEVLYLLVDYGVLLNIVRGYLLLYLVTYIRGEYHGEQRETSFASN